MKESHNDEFWVNAKYEELVRFEINEVWELVPRDDFENVIDTKCIYKNKSNENIYVTRNKSHLVARGYTQIEGVNFYETFALAAYLEALRLL